MFRTVATAIVMMAIGAGSAWAEPTRSAQTRPDESGAVVFTLGATADTVTLTAEGGGVSFEKVSEAGRFRVRIAARGDVFELAATAAGDITLRRGRKELKVRGDAVSESDARRLQEFAAGSRALRHFDLMAAALRESARPEATSVLTTHALVRSLLGDAGAARSLADKIAQRRAGGARKVALFTTNGEGPAECWDEYERAILRYSYEVEYCYYENPWNPVRYYACSSVFLIKAELAWFWLISCSGGMPVS